MNKKLLYINAVNNASYTYIYQITVGYNDKYQADTFGYKDEMLELNVAHGSCIPNDKPNVLGRILALSGEWDPNASSAQNRQNIFRYADINMSFDEIHIKGLPRVNEWIIAPADYINDVKYIDRDELIFDEQDVGKTFEIEITYVNPKDSLNRPFH